MYRYACTYMMFNTHIISGVDEQRRECRPWSGVRPKATWVMRQGSPEDYGKCADDDVYYCTISDAWYKAVFVKQNSPRTTATVQMPDRRLLRTTASVQMRARSTYETDIYSLICLHSGLRQGCRCVLEVGGCGCTRAHTDADIHTYMWTRMCLYVRMYLQWIAGCAQAAHKMRLALRRRQIVMVLFLVDKVGVRWCQRI